MNWYGPSLNLYARHSTIWSLYAGNYKGWDVYELSGAVACLAPHVLNGFWFALMIRTMIKTLLGMKKGKTVKDA